MNCNDFKNKVADLFDKNRHAHKGSNERAHGQLP